VVGTTLSVVATEVKVLLGETMVLETTTSAAAIWLLTHAAAVSL
jgi:hypothetical protein